MVAGSVEKIRNFRLKVRLKINLKFAVLSRVCVCVLYFCWMLGGFDLPMKCSARGNLTLEID